MTPTDTKLELIRARSIAIRYRNRCYQLQADLKLLRKRLKNIVDSIVMMPSREGITIHYRRNGGEEIRYKEAESDGKR